MNGNEPNIIVEKRNIPFIICLLILPEIHMVKCSAGSVGKFLIPGSLLNPDFDDGVPYVAYQLAMVCP